MIKMAKINCLSFAEIVWNVNDNNNTLFNVVFSLGQFWLDKIGKFRKYSENTAFRV